MQKVRAAGGVVFRDTGGGDVDVVLIYRNDIWDLPKGKMEPGESIRECASREVAEEIGIGLPDIQSFITETYHEYERDGEQHGKTTHWFSMQTSSDQFSPEREEGITAVEWVELEEAIHTVGFDNLESVLKAFRESR